MCTQCLLKLPADPKIKCTIGTRGNHCKECIKRKAPDGNDDKPPPPCIQFDVAKYSQCWGVISTIRDKLVALGTPGPFPASMETDISRLADHCNMLVEFATVSAHDQIKQIKQNRVHREEKEELRNHLDHVRKEVAHLNVDKNKTARQHKNELNKLQDTIKAREARISELGSVIRTVRMNEQRVQKAHLDSVEACKKAKVTDAEVKEAMDID